MKFHPEKCKILSVNNFYRNLFQELPFYYFPYQLHKTIFDYTPEEKDLGICVTSKFGFKAHQTYILNKAVTQFNILRRTCHFVNNKRKAIAPKYGVLLVQPLSLLKLFKNAVLSGFTGKASHPIMKVYI